MDKQDVVNKMNQVLNNKVPNNQNVILNDQQKIYIDSLPKMDQDDVCFLIVHNEDIIMVCVQEIDWVTLQYIELNATRNSVLSSDVRYYSGEYERRNILDKSIKWVADIKEERLENNEKGDLLQKLNFELVDKIWEKYYLVLTLNSEEAEFIYSSASDYFSGNSKNKVIPPIVIEVDLLCQIGNLSRAEIQKIKASDMQRIKLILKARSETLQNNNVPTKEKNNVNVSDNDMQNYFNSIHVR